MINSHKKYAKVEGHPNLIRDLSTNAIINTDSFSSEQYNKIRNSKKEEKQKIEKLHSDVEDLKSSVDEIKQLLRSIVNGT
jgi:gas vesicle protein